MANPTTNFGWVMPTSSSLVTNLPADFNTFGQAVDTSMAQLKGGTTGQILSKTSATDMAFTWITNDVGDITAVNTTAPLAGGGTSGALTLSIASATTAVVGAVQLSDSTSTTSSVLAATPTAVKSAYDLAAAAVPKSTVTTGGDVIYATGSSAVTRLGIGTAGQVLTVNSGATAPEWKTPASGATFAGCLLSRTASQSVTTSTDTATLFDAEIFDTDNYHSLVTNTSRVTIPTGKSGYYQINANLTFGGSSTGTREINIFKNGTRIFWDTYPPNGTTQVSSQIALVYYCTAADYFELYCWQNSGGNLNIQGSGTAPGATTFSFAYLGA